MPSRKNRLVLLAVVAAGLIGLGYFAYTSFREPGGALLPAAAVVLLAGVLKVATYEAGFLIRGLTDRKPHATYCGAIGHGAILYAVTAAAFVLA